MSVFERPSRIGVVDDGERIYLGVLPSGPIHVLDGTGAVIWDHALGRDEDEAVRAVAEASGQPEDVVREDTVAFLNHLVSRGLLERVDR